ncbi:MAG: hypothetical protein LKE61_08110 [Erysipelotrichaceae bacterium]|nr:hypothetical protein [Erysipelotrichaceae bacterium]MCI1326925.1 hypothetical protein [Solobacterium sp.]MCH4044183.1 hypothetical protein [Erysipelotrichaceae bacterium]MCH4121397.1 hypothetical protein [Erysipelotrichaceae bacterium]MCI1363884.1 hypothetical protein [Solobacterium sp.]
MSAQNADLLTSSSLTYNREKEVKMLCDPATGQWLQQQNIRLVSYANLH